MNDAKDAVHKHIVYFESENDDGTVEIAMQWNTSYQSSPSSRSPTTSTPTRAARTSQASVRR